MNAAMEGKIIYVSLDEIKDYKYSRQKLHEYSTQELSRGNLSNTDNPNTKKLILDILSNADFYDADIKGFLYSDGKFLGHLHYIADANLPKQSVDGSWVKIGDGYEISGILYVGQRPDCGFVIRIGIEGVDSVPAKPIKSQRSKNSLQSASIKEVIVKKAIKDIELPFWDKDLLNMVTAKAEKKKIKKGRKGYDVYSHAISWKPKPENSDDLLLAMCVAYAWMPTMLDVYIADKKELNILLKAVKGLGTINSIQEFDSKREQALKWLLQLIPVINNSVVGTSKVLHLFYPNTIPIIDSNVLKGWKMIMGKYYKHYPSVQLPVTIPGVCSRQIEVYLKYWRALLVMKRNTRVKRIRVIEEPFYWLGMN